jgi:DNA-binding transcriptional LysR family regulator
MVLVHRHDLPPSRIPGTLAELARQPVITFTSGISVRRLIEQAFTRSGLEFRPAMELANVEMIKAMVLGGLGLGIIPDGCLPFGELASRPLPECVVARTLRLLLPQRAPTPAAARIAERLRGLARP